MLHPIVFDWVEIAALDSGALMRRLSALKLRTEEKVSHCEAGFYSDHELAGVNARGHETPFNAKHLVV
jgi:hypothetical protein